MQNLRIDIGVGGLYHADYMAGALIEAGHSVDVFTTLSRKNFPLVPAKQVHSYPWPDMVFRAARQLGMESAGDLFKMKSFGAWMAKTAARQGRARDLSILWSSWALETLRRRTAQRHIVVRDSAHILFQNDVLAREFRRLKLPYPDRRRWLDRELAEYALADAILVPSEFARLTFLERGFSPDKVKLLRLGVNVSLFQAEAQIAPKLPLQVVYFGPLSVQKGVHYLLEATRDFSPHVLQVQLVGKIHPEFRSILRLYPHADHLPSMGNPQLAAFLRTKDVFVFPSLHDGFGHQLVEAMASGMCSIATDHCGASELIREGENGFIVPAGNVTALRDRLTQLTEDLALVKKLRAASSQIGKDLSWNQYGRTLTDSIAALFSEKPAEARRG